MPRAPAPRVGSADPKRSPALAIIAIMVVSFSLSFAVLWRQQKGASPPSRAPLPAAPVHLARSESVSVPAAPVAREPQSAPSQAPPPPATTPPAHSYEGPDLPVVFGIINKSVYTVQDDEHGVPTNVTRNVNEAIVSNSSERPLTITVTELDQSKTKFSQGQLMLPPGAQRHFGEDLGLQMLSGDELTLASASYHDLIRQIP
jgi:hypothetical protein